ncbi:MAG: Ig-like domain-containing protein [Gemmatimonadaceae bacterium]|nr:Ig-like domain-containing protein [Gemmatimonadaceae bacterium]
MGRLRDVRRLLIHACVCVLFACGGGDSNKPDVAPTVTITSSGGASVASGSTLQLNVRATDRKGGVVPTSSVQWSSPAPTIASVSTTGLVTGTIAGTAAITASYDGVSTAFTVTVIPGAPVRLVMRTQPSGAASGAFFTTQPVVEVRDAAENVVTTSTVTITAAIASGGGLLTGLSVLTASGGAVSFGDLAIIGTQGARTLAFTSPGLSPAVSNSFVLTPGAAARLVVRTQPSGALAGVLFTTQPVIEVRDGADNVVTTATPLVTATVSAGGGTLSGTAAVTAVNGVATFTTLRIAGLIGNRTLTFSAPGLTAATTETFVLQPGAATALGVRVAAVGGGLNAPFTTVPVVELRDASGNVATAAPATSISASITSGGGTLTGASASATNGVATFVGFGINGVGGARTIRFTAPALTETSFTVSPCDASRAPELQLSSAARTLTAFNPIVAFDTVLATDAATSCQPITQLGTSIVYAGAAGWLTATALSSPTRIALRADPTAVTVAGTYNATVNVSSTNAGARPLAVTFQVRPSASITFGADNQKVLPLETNGTITIAAIVRSDGLVVPSAPVTYVSRSNTIATVSASGLITARAVGQTWLVASTTQDGGAADSLYVQVVSPTGVLLRADITRFSYIRGTDFSMSLYLDTRGATIGAATVVLNWPAVGGTPGLLRLNETTPGTIGSPLITSDAGSGTSRITIASATGMSGVIFLGRFDFTPINFGSSLFALRFSELIDLSQQSLLGTATALQYPLVFR